MYCQVCGNTISTIDKCPNCRTLMPKLNIIDPSKSILCRGCGRSNNHLGKYCWNCAMPLNKSDDMTNIIKDKVLNAIQKHKQGDIMKFNRKDVQIGLWGPTAAGKTVFMLSLYVSAMQDGSDWSIGFDENTDQQKRKFFMDNADALRDGIWPDPTVVNQDPDLYGLLFYPSPDRPKVKIKKVETDLATSFWKFFSEEPEAPTRPSQSGLHVSFADVSGESYLNEPPESPLWQHLAGCNGIICLLDPADIKNQLRITANLVDYLYAKVKREKPDAIINGQYLPHYISVCFTKMDRPEWQSMKDSPEDVIKKISDVTDLNIKRQLWVHFSPERIKFHCISSVGQEFHEKKSLSGSEKPGRVRPMNVSAPLNDWLEK